MNWLKRLLYKAEKKEVAQTSGSKQSTCIWAIAGGKGGVGKSMVTVNMGILLARRGHTVLLIDADLGAANLHTFFGLEGSKVSLSSFLKGNEPSFERLIMRTTVANLDLLSGANDSLDVADLSGEAVERLAAAVEKADYEYVILDLGPGTSSNNLDLFLTSDEGILVTSPEPTSIENTYRFLKCLYLRRIRNIITGKSDTRLKELLHRLFYEQPNNVKTISDILLGLKRLDPERGNALQDLLGGTRVSLLVNQCRRTEDSELGYSMRRACNNFFGVSINCLGHISLDDAVYDSIRLKIPLAINFQQSRPARELEACFSKLLASDKVTYIHEHAGGGKAG